MFTGLISDLGTALAVRRRGSGIDIEIGTHLIGELSEGASVAVNGVCLTVSALAPASLIAPAESAIAPAESSTSPAGSSIASAGRFTAHAIAQTLRTTSLGTLAPGRRVNLELALRIGDRLGGHVVQGHVDGVCTVAATRLEGSSKVLELACDGAIWRHLVAKGSVALDGVSLTISALHDQRFEVCLIPETCRRTTLGQAEVGDTLNVEVDVLSKYVERLLSGAVGERCAPAVSGADAGRASPPQ
jgi:riboflavin synthase alpha subunit